MKNAYKKFLLSSALLCAPLTGYCGDNISPFPLEHYSQSIAQWINPQSEDYDKSLLTPKMQQVRFDDFYQHEWGTLSPWNAHFVNQLLNQTGAEELQTVEQSIIDGFDNKNKSAADTGYGENFIPYSSSWLENITKNIHLSAWGKLNYSADNRAIATDNLFARALPTADPFFYSDKIAGEGYPFDLLQMSSIWVGTPLYILRESADLAWSLVLTPEFIGWVPSNKIARVNNAFVSQWETAAKNSLAAITHTGTSIVDETNQFLFTAYVGSVFPVKQMGSRVQIYVPVANHAHQAEMKSASVAAKESTLMPLSTTPKHFAEIMETLIGRTYGWGNSYFYNDCSAELKNLFTPFGIWLPRNSAQQPTAGNAIDMTGAAPAERLDYLAKNGKKFLTIVYLGGHVVLFMGNAPNPNSPEHAMMALLYQNMWGLYPDPAVRRAVIGRAVIFPLLLQYPEDTSLTSQAAHKNFKIAFLDELPDNIDLQHTNLKSYMLPAP